MFDPETFAEKNQCCVETTAAALKKYNHLFRWTGDKDTAMDVGCGPGNLLAEVFYPVLKKCCKIYATDISNEMVDFCREKYTSPINNLICQQMDLESELDVQKFLLNHSPIGHVFASFVFHWMLDEEKALRNVFNLLTPGGDFFTVHFHSNLTFFMNIAVQKSVKWGHFFENLDKHVPKSTTEDHSEKELYNLFEKCGFIDTVVELNRSTLTLQPKDFLPLIRSVHVQINNIPKVRIAEYMDDYVNLGIEKGFIRVKSDGGYEFDFNTYVAFGRKPE